MHVIKTKINKFDYIRIENVFITRHNRVKGQATSWEKKFVTHITNKGLI